MLCEPTRAEGSGDSKAELLARRCLSSGIEFFHDPDQHGWASVTGGTALGELPAALAALSSVHAADLLSRNRRESRLPGAARGTGDIRGAARCSTVPSRRSISGSPSIGGKLYLDLCDPEWQAVEIDRDGWRVVEGSPRSSSAAPRGSQPLPVPQRGGSIEELRPFLNVDHDGWVLIKAFLVAALKPAMPYPILVAKGEQGAGKSTACRVITSLDRSAHLGLAGRSARSARPGRRGAQLLAGMLRQPEPSAQ